MPPHPLTNFEILKYYQKERSFSGAYSRNNLAKIKDGTYVINLDEYKSWGTQWIALYVTDDNGTYIASFGVHKQQKYYKKYYRIQAYCSVKCGYSCIGFIDFLLNLKLC